MLALAFVALSPSAPVHGATRLVVSPLIVDLTLAAGQAQTFELRAANDGETPLLLEFEHADFGFGSNRYDLVFVDDSAEDTTAFSTRGWFSTRTTRFRLQPGESRTIEVRVAVPKATAAGSYLGAAFVRSRSDARPSAGAAVTTATRAGALVFVTVSGGAPPEPVIRDIELSSMQTGQPVHAGIVVGNDGDSHFSFGGSVRLTRAKDTRVADLREMYVLPDLDRRISVRLGGDASASEQVEASIEDPLAIGRYELTVELTPRGSIGSTTATTNFWYAPLWLWLAGAFVASSLVGGLVVAVVSRWRRHGRGQASGTSVSEHEF